jgi:WD40 repeat protein
MPRKPQSLKRKRGVILSDWGLQRLQAAQEQLEITANQGDRYTLEQLSLLTGISARSIRKVRNCQETVDRQTLEDLFRAFQLTLTLEDYVQPEVIAETEQSASIIPIRQDWGEALDVSLFFGRDAEQLNLKQWIVQNHCRLVGILGMGGIGKTALSVKLAEQLQAQFAYVIWRSLRNAPPLATLLRELVCFLSDQQDSQAEISHLLQCLRHHRCLVILDNLETILQPGKWAGEYRPGYEDYGDLLKTVAESHHQSCLVLTSREKPREIATLEGIGWAVRSLQLKGSPEACQGLVAAMGLIGSDSEPQQLSDSPVETLCDRYGENPLALKIVSASIRELFDGNITAFLQEDTLIFNGLRRLLDQQFERLSALEQAIMYELAINREWTTIAELAEDLLPTVSRAGLLEALESLSWRSLVERKGFSYTQQPVVMEYVTEQLIEKIIAELNTLQLSFYDRHSLSKTTVPDYIRDSQSRLILQPITVALTAQFPELEQHLQLVLQAARAIQAPFFGYAVGNTINLYLQLQIDLTSYDFSHCKIRQAYLAGAILQQTNFTGANFKQSIFAQPCNEIYALTFSLDGQRFATGEADSQIRIWNTADGQLLLTITGHTNSIRSLSFSPDGTLLASGSNDHTVRLWNADTGQCLKVLSGHSHLVLAIAWSPDGQTLASGSADHTIRLWKLSTGECYQILQTHHHWVWAVAWSPDGHILATGSADQTIRLWHVPTGKTIKVLAGHSSYVTSVHFSPSGQTLASGSADQTIRLWHVPTGDAIKVLAGHSSYVTSVHFSPSGQTLASGSADQTIRLWDIDTGRILKSLHGHTSVVFAVRFAPDGVLLASGGEDHTIKLWNVATGQTLRTMRGSTGWLYAAQFSPNGRLLASGGDEPVIRLWDVQTKQMLAALPGHTLWVRSVQFSPDGDLLASCSADQTIRLWHIPTRRLVRVLHGHTEEVRSICFSPVPVATLEGYATLLASGSQDQTIRLWQVETGTLIQTLHEHTGWVRCVDFSSDGRCLASGSDDHTVKLWHLETGQVSTLEGHSNWLRSVKFSPDGKTLASSSDDQTIRVWNVQTGDLTRIFQGETNWTRSLSFSSNGAWLASAGMDRTVRLWDLETGQALGLFRGHTLGVLSVAFSPDDLTLISCSADETIRFWDVQTGECLHILRSDRPYQGMNITGVIGITAAQQATLKALGAIVR